MPSIGDELRGERLRRGIKLEQVVAETKINKRYLIAMEEDRFDQFGIESFFKRNFLCQYARLLGLDEETLVSLFTQRFETNLPPPPKPQPSPPFFPLPSTGAVLSVLAVLACVGAYRLHQNDRSSLFQPKTSATPLVTKNHSGTLPSAPSMALADLPSVESRRVVGPQLDALAQADRAVSSDPGALPRGNPSMHVELRATEPVWISINSDGVYSYIGALETKQTKRIDAYTKLTILVRNAGGLEVLLNGRTLGPLGARGEVLSLEFTPEGLRVVRDVKAPPSDPAESMAPKGQAGSRYNPPPPFWLAVYCLA